MQATSPYPNRPPRSLKTMLLARIIRAASAGHVDILAEQLLADYDTRRATIKPRRATQTDGADND